VYNFLGCIDAFSKYGTFTIGYGALGETSVVGRTPSTYVKEYLHLLTSLQEIPTTIMEVKNEIVSKWYSQVAQKAFHTKHVKPH
jgi:hypothetical protein